MDARLTKLRICALGGAWRTLAGCAHLKCRISDVSLPQSRAESTRGRALLGALVSRFSEHAHPHHSRRRNGAIPGPWNRGRYGLAGVANYRQARAISCPLSQRAL